MKGLIIVPTYNESNNVKELIPEILKQDKNIDVLIVDDNSPDGTAKIVEAMIKEEKRIHLLKRKKKAGLGKAYVAGFKWALQSKKHYEYVCEMDADFSHDPNEVHLLIEALEEGYDASCGSRYIRGVRVLNWDLKRLFISLIGNFYARFATGIKLTDLTGGYNCYKRSVIETLNLDNISSSGYSFQIEMKAKAIYKGFKIKEVPIIFRDRFEGTTKMSGGIINEALFKCWKIRLDKWLGRI
jgi:dolichol-phosphate mannosyltransferase